jgi:hypothetical protein
MTTKTIAKTDAQRQADRKARELAAGRVQWKRWVHPDDVLALAEYAFDISGRMTGATAGGSPLDGGVRPLAWIRKCSDGTYEGPIAEQKAV